MESLDKLTLWSITKTFKAKIIITWALVAIENALMAFYDRYGCNKAVPGCTFNPKVAPFAVLGVNFTLAETYARIGQKQKAVKYLLKSQMPLILTIGDISLSSTMP
ncbi:hypothetical protein JQC92_01100 [Shewanella sp. 202IG2-18]|uniref:hypothetical protein n=1 Tax=Parashewanella hymeniacidonis TaxID=2807618 RepID=UPI0019609C5D|nr:hypothetical protein [Parashewanella hymeniacidonis]MBM7070642.1 hypothetical protein [Parashewanella hymeniacidonis]